MKNLLLVFCLICFSYSYSQTDKNIISLDYAAIEIEIPKDCKATSKHELLDCYGISVQWIYFNKEMLESAAEQVISQYSKGSSSKKQIKAESHGTTLNGFQFTYKDSSRQDRIILYGTVNNQPLILNVASEDELIAIYSNEFLNQIVSFKK